MNKAGAIEQLNRALRIADDIAYDFHDKPNSNMYNYALGRVRGIQLAINTLEGME